MSSFFFLRILIVQKLYSVFFHPLFHLLASSSSFLLTLILCSHLFQCNPLTAERKSAKSKYIKLIFFFFFFYFLFSTDQIIQDVHLFSNLDFNLSCLSSSFFCVLHICTVIGKKSGAKKGKLSNLKDA